MIKVNPICVAKYNNNRLTNLQFRQAGRGHWTVNYTGTQSFINMFSLIVGLKTFGLIVEICLLA